MKSIVIFYSFEGSTKLIADMIARETAAETLELKPEKEIPKGGFKKFFWGGKSVIFKDKPKLLNTIPNLEQYDIIFIGTPIWAGSFTPPINTLISNISVKNKKIVLFACNSGGGADKCFEKLKNRFSDNTILGTISFIDPIKDDKNKINTQLKNWLSEIL
ncbi:MAG: flavodoxin [Anaerocolumna sp.]